MASAESANQTPAVLSKGRSITIAVVLVIILFAAIILRLVCFSGFFGSDDGSYAALAWRMSDGNWQNVYTEPRNTPLDAPVFPLRLGIVAPTALAFLTLGPSETALVFYPFLLSMLTILLAYFITKVWFGVRAGLIAALLWAALPIDCRTASMLLPDIPAAFWAGAGILLIIVAVDKQRIETTAISRRMLFGYGLGAGLLFFFSWLCKEAVTYLIPFIAIFLLWQVHKQRNNLWLALGALTTVVLGLLLESGYYHHITGDWLYRLHETQRNYVVCSVWLGAENEHGDLLHLLRILLFSRPRALLLAPELSAIGAIALVACLWALLRRIPGMGWPALWFVSCVIMFDAASADLTHYRLLPIIPRYAYLMLLPAVVCIAGVLSRLSKSAPAAILLQRRIAVGAVMGILVIGFVVQSFVTNRGLASPVERRVAQIVKPMEALYTDSRTAWMLQFFWHYPRGNATDDFEALEANKIPAGSYVLINPERLDLLTGAYHYHPPRFIGNIPPHWQSIWHYQAAVLYRVMPEPARSQSPEPGR
jgi:4-amino-4-deoxy-L-arabinose transferase-like glycosyltransferase